MEFGIFSNGFRRSTAAGIGSTYEEDISEIVLADRLGFRDAYISEHHAEPSHIGAVDMMPAPELMVCKLAALTKRIRLGAAVRLIHLHHPLDVAVQSAVVSHLLGSGRYIFGFGTGFTTPLFSEARGLSYQDRHARVREALDFIFKCWTSEAPFDWSGRFWTSKDVLALPKPDKLPSVATATDTDDMIVKAGTSGWNLLTAHFEHPASIRRKAELYARAASAAGRNCGRQNIVASRIIHIAKTERQAKDEMRSAVAFEVGIQAQRGFLSMLKKVYGIEVPNSADAIDVLAEAGVYVLGDPDSVASRIKQFFFDSGGFGTFLFVVGKDWATREARANSMRLFMEQVAPQIRPLQPRDEIHGVVSATA
jgi:alkanesulfonate monooxygenase SsuD/methylene tetrahydromethanopterin reductase-like flavin-dependent oxidoreductase (luciferase family)